ncbi:MAG: lipoprotein [Ahniella sp.]|nr:lipoprotein [Ahniella sp.]
MALLLMTATLLVGCGQKGDLVRPEAPKAAPAAT